MRHNANSARTPLERRSDGKLWSHTSVGSYPLIYITANGGELCPNCANGENGSLASETLDPECPDDKQWLLVGCDVYWEGAPRACDHCNAEIESAYGDFDEESADALNESEIKGGK